MSQDTQMTIRLDQLLLNRGLVASRARARDAIQRGTVKVDGRTVTKPASTFAQSVTLTIDDPAQDYVSRAALKLVAALDHFGLDPSEQTCLDVGASTGGFTEVLLKRGAAHVVAVDVGHGQIHPRVAEDPRVTNIEGLNARSMTRGDVGERAITFIVSDVSFISLKLALPPALSLAEPTAWGVFLVKPQFEVGREWIGKGGIVRDPVRARDAAEAIAAWLAGQGWSIAGLLPSPLAGGDGNQEFLIGARNG